MAKTPFMVINEIRPQRRTNKYKLTVHIVIRIQCEVLENEEKQY